MINLTTDVYKDNKFVRHLGHLELEMAIRDICFFYNDQTQWASFNGGSPSFGYTLALPYWDYLDLRGSIGQVDKDLVRKGSLLILLCECLEFFEDLGTYYLSENDKLLSLKSSVKVFDPADKKEKEIKDCILALAEKVETNDREWEKTWDGFLNRLFVTDVYGHFRNKLKTFDSHWETLYIKYSEK
jgi:hypothetical protein